LLRLFVSIKRNPLLVVIKMSTIMSNTGTLSLKLIRKKLIINCATPDKLKPMSGYPNRLRLKEKQALKCRKKDYLLTQELTS
jgi:hypothetical protein